MKRDRITVAAGSFAFRWFLSLFPIIIALLGVSSLVGIPRHVMNRLVHGVTTALPDGAASVLTSAMEHSEAHQSGAVTAVVIAAVVAVWSATSGMVIVEEGLDMALEISTDGAFVAKRLRAVPMLLAAVLLGGGASALIVFGASIGHALKGAVGPLGGAFDVGWTVVRWAAALALIGVLFSVIYHLAPNRRRGRWRWITPGAVLGTALWALITVAFSFYTSVSGSYSKTYGAFAGVAILIFWLYLTGVAVLLGGEINAAFERVTAPAPSPGAAGPEGDPPG
jgi:membrane protein